jgi:hypothetical protein
MSSLVSLPGASTTLGTRQVINWHKLQLLAKDGTYVLLGFLTRSLTTLGTRQAILFILLAGYCYIGQGRHLLLGLLFFSSRILLYRPRVALMSSWAS